MSSVDLTAPAPADLRPIGFAQLVGAHLRIWRGHQPVLITATVAVLFGVGMVAFGVSSHKGAVDAGALRSEFDLAKTAFSFFWPIIGAVAGASAFTSRWALIVLVMAPRRGRWLLANLGSFLLVPTATVVVFLTAAWAAMAACGVGVGLAAVVFTQLGSVLIATLVNAAAGFLLGCALRSITMAIVAMFLLPLVLQLAVRSIDISSWLSLDAATNALSSGTLGAHHGLPIITAALVWLVAPAYVAWTRLRSSAG